MLELHESGEVSVGKVSGTRSVLDLHESRDGDPGVDLEGEKLDVERGTVVGVLGEIEEGIVEGILEGIVGGVEGKGEGEEFEGGSAGLGSKVFLTQSITGLTRSRKGIPRIIACAPIGATKKLS